jgi:predicted DNA-binding transcriptional regulator AlpA
MDARILMLQRKEVCKELGTNSAGLHRGMLDGRYPKPYRTGENSVRWKSNEIQECINKLEVAVPVEVAPGIRKGRKASASNDELHNNLRNFIQLIWIIMRIYWLLSALSVR